MKVLVTGASGLLGSHLMTAAARRHDCVGLDRHPWWGDQAVRLRRGELTAPGFIEAAMREEAPDVIVHCAAMVNVDACENDPDAAFSANARLTRAIVSAAPPGALFVYITTDGIFRGDHPFATEEQPPAPLTVYGRSKLQGEEEVRSASDRHLIIRTNFYGWSSRRKQTSAEWVYDTLVAGSPMTAFDDFFFTPIYVGDFVERLCHLIEADHHGTFHLCGADRVSKYDFVLRMASLASLPIAAVTRGSIDDAKLTARRPKDMSLDCMRATRVLHDPMPGCDDGLRRFLAHRGLPLHERFPGHPAVEHVGLEHDAAPKVRG